MKKQKKLKTRVGIFKNMAGNILEGILWMGIFRGEFTTGSLMSGNFPGGSFPDTSTWI